MTGGRTTWELEAELARVQAERDDLYEQNWPWEWVIATREKERRQAAEDQVGKLTEALRKYGSHQRSCELVGSTSGFYALYGRMPRCICGFSDALAPPAASSSCPTEMDEEQLHRCPVTSSSDEKCRYWRGHDASGEPHSWTRFRIGGPHEQAAT